MNLIRINFMITVILFLIITNINSYSQQCSNSLPNGGNVGIGTSSPTVHLQLHQPTENSTCPPIFRLSYGDNMNPLLYGTMVLLTEYGESWDDFTRISNRLAGDLVINHSHRNGSIILTNRNDQGFIRFATTTEDNPNSQDYERMTISPAGNVNIGSFGTFNAGAKLSVTNGNVLFNGNSDDYNNALPTGAGTRFMWIAGKASLRGGIIESACSTYWDNANIGNYSVAFGINTKALPPNSFTMGWNAVCDFINPQSPGDEHGAVAIGHDVTAKGYDALCLGFESHTTGHYSYLIGSNSSVEGTRSYALGDHAVVGSGSDNSVAIGSNVSTGTYSGSMILGDGSFATQSTLTTVEGINQLVARFAGGTANQPAYKLYTSSGSTPYVYINPGQSAWQGSCDRNIKRIIKPVDGESVLAAIKSIPFNIWTLKTFDTLTKHLGPFAQDFYYAFDGIGGDSLGLGTYDMEGVAQAGVKALIFRTEALSKENNELKARLDTLEAKMKIMGIIENNNPSSENIILEQNIPNPFSEFSYINYYIPDDLNGKVEIIIRDIRGDNNLKRFQIQKGIANQITVYSKDFSNGAYLYSIALNNKILLTKKMLVIH